MFNFELGNLVFKSQWIERSLPNYIPLRIAQAVTENVNHSSTQLTINSVVIDVIYAFAKNSRWHTSPLFLEALSLQIERRYGVVCDTALDIASDLLGNSSLESEDADRLFSKAYLSVWHNFPFRESSEGFCGLSHDWYESLKDKAHLPGYFAPSSLMEWFVDLQNSNSMWKADELRMMVDANLDLDHQEVNGQFFSNLFLTINSESESGLDSDAIKKLERAGLIYRLREEKQLFSLSIDGQKLTARYQVFQSFFDSQSASFYPALSEFQGWCEPWQRCFLQSSGPCRRPLVQAMIATNQLPKISVIAEFVGCLLDEFGIEFTRNFLTDGLSSHASNWVRAVMLASGKHLLDDETIKATAISLFDVPSDEIQRMAADVLFS